MGKEGGGGAVNGMASVVDDNRDVRTSKYASVQQLQVWRYSVQRGSTVETNGSHIR